MEQCVCFYIGWLDNCVCARQNQWERVWLENHNSLTPSFRSSRYTQLLYLNHLHHHTHTHTHTLTLTVQKQPVREEGNRGSGRGESKKGGCWALKASSCPGTRHCSLTFLRTAEKLSLQGERERQALTDVHTHMRVTPGSGVCHKCIVVCYFTAAAEVLWLLLKSL